MSPRVHCGTRGEFLFVASQVIAGVRQSTAALNSAFVQDVRGRVATRVATSALSLDVPRLCLVSTWPAAIDDRRLVAWLRHARLSAKGTSSVSVLDGRRIMVLSNSALHLTSGAGQRGAACR